MTLSQETTIRLKRAAIDMSGLPGVLSGGGMLAIAGGLATLLHTWLGATQPHLPVSAGVAALAIGLPAAIVGGVLHERRYRALARAAGLSDAEAKALADQADAEDYA